MTIPFSVQKPALLRSIETDLGTSIAKGIWGRLKDQLQWINESIPLGGVYFFYDSQTYANGSPIADPNSCWQFCDGSPIVNPNSPMFGQNTVDLRDLFGRGGTLAEFTLGGQSTINLDHDHDATTTAQSALNNETQTRSGNAGMAWGTHTHPVSLQLLTVPNIPPFVELQPYMRVC
jgi:hypothetical protein